MIYQIKRFCQFIGLTKILRSLGLNKILFGGTGFHRDRILRKLAKALISELKVTSFIETGTFQGGSIYFVAKNFPNLLIFSCEINEKYYQKAKSFLSKFSQVNLFLSHSERFLQDLTSRETGEFPLFFLDAHGHGFPELPLKKEVAIITRKWKKAIIIIDDFKVPERNDFAYIEGCELVKIKSALNPENIYFFSFPKYSQKESQSLTHIGYMVIWQNSEKEFEFFQKKPWFRKYYFSLPNENWH